MEAFRSRWRLRRTPGRSAPLPAQQAPEPGQLVGGESEPEEMQKKRNKMQKYFKRNIQEVKQLHRHSFIHCRVDSVTSNFLSSRLLCPMAAFTSGLAFFLLVLTSDVGGTQEVEAKTSEAVVLPCRSPSEKTITLLEWKKQGQDSEGFVFFFRENRSYESYQIPSFKRRVQLSDPSMKDGNVSVTVKNVTSSDSGEYECSFYVSRNHRSRRATDYSYTVKLRVVDGDSTGGSDQHGGRRHLAIAVPLLAVFMVLIVVMWKVKSHTEQPAADEAGGFVSDRLQTLQTAISLVLNRR